MRFGPVVALAAVAALAASPALAQTFENFKTFCLDTGGEAERAVAASAAAGWQVDPRGEAISADADVRLWSDPATGTPPVEILMIGHVPLPNTIDAPSCSVMGRAPFEALSDAMTAWAGFAPERTNRGNAAWVYTMGSDGPVPQRDLVQAEKAEFLAAARTSGRLHIVQLGQALAGPLVSHAYVDPDTPISQTR